MKKSSIGKRAVSGVCALTLALSMPVLAFGTGDQEPVTEQQELAQAAADTTNATFDDTTNKVSTTIDGVDSGLAVQPSSDPDAASTDDASVSVEYVADASITSQDELDAAIKDADQPILQEVATPSGAFEEAKTGGDDFTVGTGLTKDEVKDLLASEDNYISTNTFEVNPVSEATTGATVTVVYTTDENAENVECYAYYTYKDGNGTTVNKVEKLTGTNGVYTLNLGQVAEAEVTFVLTNSATTVQAAPATTHQDNGGNDTDGYELVYTTGTTKKLNGNGAENWSAFATAGVRQANATAVPAYLSIAANETVANASPSFASWQHNFPFDYAKVINVTVSSTANADDVSNATISANVGAANRVVRVFWDETVDGQVVGKWHDVTSDADGNITVPGVALGTIYTLAVAPADATPPVNPDDPDIPVIPDQPVNPDNPNLPIIPGGDVDGTGSGEGNSGAAGNGAAAADNGATSPKTGIFA